MVKLPKDISVVIPVYNGEGTIAQCLDSLLSLNYPRSHLEIIVVDNDSTDRTPQLIKARPVHYLREERKGSYISRNTGIRKAGGKLIALTDADCIVDKDWLKNLSQGFDKDGRIAACGGRIETYKPKNIVERFSAKSKRVLNQERAINSPPLFLPAVITANAIYRRDVISKIGLFDEGLVSWGDVDLSWRIQLSGFKVKYIPQAVVFHQHRRSVSALYQQYFRMGYGMAFILEKYSIQIIKRKEKRFYSFLREAKNISHLSWKAFVSLITAKDEEKRLFPFLDFVLTMAHLTGRKYGSFKKICSGLLGIDISRLVGIR